MTTRSILRGYVDRLGPQLILIWAGLSIGVAFLATPAKFLAPSLTLPVALDVGRQTFQVYSQTELVLLFALVVLGGWSKSKGRWYLILAIPGLVVVAQALWLLPALDHRVSAIETGATHLPPSNLHRVYVAAEAAKVVSLLAGGLVGFAGPSKPFCNRQWGWGAYGQSQVPLEQEKETGDESNSAVPPTSYEEAVVINDSHTTTRMLINSILSIAIGIVVFLIAWRIVVMG